MEINIRNVFAEKNPKLARLLPGFVYWYIEHVIHQRELNAFLALHGKKMNLPFLEEVIKYFNVTISSNGFENLAQNERYLFVSNHPLGGFDGIMLMKAISDNCGSVKVLVNDILMNIKNLEDFFLPINKHGSQDKSAALAIDEIFNSHTPLLTFPAGLCSRKINGKIVDLEWKKNFIQKAISSKRQIVPIYFKGRNSNFFYSLSNIRKRIGIKANIEMFYLVDELFKHRNGFFTITIGKPIDYKIFEDKKINPRIWAERVKSHVYELSENPDAKFKP